MYRRCGVTVIHTKINIVYNIPFISNAYSHLRVWKPKQTRLTKTKNSLAGRKIRFQNLCPMSTQCSEITEMTSIFRTTNKLNLKFKTRWVNKKQKTKWHSIQMDNDYFLNQTQLESAKGLTRKKWPVPSSRSSSFASNGVKKTEY